MKVLITGASQGIGRELALKLAEERHQQLLIARKEDQLRAVCALCNDIAGVENAQYIAYDLNNLVNGYKEIQELINEKIYGLDTLVNNAGRLIKKSFINLEIKEAQEMFNSNYFAPMQLIRATLPMLRKSSHGSIINVTSMGGILGSQKFSGLSAYSASKGALAILTECLATEFREMGIRVNSLAFGAVQTAMLEEAFPGYWAGTTAREMADFFKWFVVDGFKRFNGKVLPVTDSVP